MGLGPATTAMKMSARSRYRYVMLERMRAACAESAAERRQHYCNRHTREPFAVTVTGWERRT